MRIIAKAGVTEIEIYEEIGKGFFGGVTAQQVSQALKDAKGSDLLVRLNSPGGDVFEGIAIYNVLSQAKQRVNTQIDGMAFSAASVVFMAGEQRRMAENAFLMIHRAWSIIAGNAEDLRERADKLDAIGSSMAKVYADRTGADIDTVLAWMEAETWFGAESDEDVRNAVDDGFATEIIENLKVAAAWDPQRHHLKHPPKALPRVPRSTQVHLRTEKMAARARRL